MALHPFPILRYETGLFGYLDAWVAPQDAFTVLENAYVYRGALHSRKGSRKIAHMVYKDFGFTRESGTLTYSGTIANAPLLPGSVRFRSPLGSIEDNGEGILFATQAEGTINYETGEWEITFLDNIPQNYNVEYSSLKTPICGLAAWKDPKEFVQKTVIMDGQRAAVYVNASTFPLDQVKQPAYVFGKDQKELSVNLRWPNQIIPSSVKITIGTTVYTANAAGAFTPSGDVTALAYNAQTSQLTATFSVAPEEFTPVLFEATTSGNLFNGADYYFSGINYLGILYLTNNVDPITCFDGDFLFRPHFSVQEEQYKAFTNQIKRCQGFYVFKNRLLLYGAEIENAGELNGLDGQTIRWSTVPVPGSWLYALNNLVADVPGYGGFIRPSTEDFLKSITTVRDRLVLWYQNSTFVLSYTGNWFDPFQSTQINKSRSTNTSYGSIEYDDMTTSMGNKGLIVCDGVNVTRYDLQIPDAYQDINQDGFERAFAFRDDTENQSWMLYPSDSFDVEQNDVALIYNFLEKTWCKYVWMSPRYNCLSSSFVSFDKKWEDFEEPWEEVEETWDAFYYQKNTEILIGGGYQGEVYALNEGFYDDDVTGKNFQPITFSVKTGRWGPFLDKGQKTRFVFLDIYYATVSASTDAQFSFYADSEDAPASITDVVFEGTDGSHKFKRIYINVTAALLQMQIDSLPDFRDLKEGGITIYGMILWAEPAGRLIA